MNDVVWTRRQIDSSELSAQNDSTDPRPSDFQDSVPECAATQPRATGRESVGVCTDASLTVPVMDGTRGVHRRYLSWTVTRTVMRQASTTRGPCGLEPESGRCRGDRIDDAS